MTVHILGHQQKREFLNRLRQGLQSPHALLFYGNEGIGKKLVALDFAKALLCLKQDNAPCQKCESCRLLNLTEGSFAHPDFYYVEKEQGTRDIKLEQAQEMSKQMVI